MFQSATQSMLALGLMLPCIGCGDANGLYPVCGRVAYQGQPAVGATVSFVPRGIASHPGEQVAQGVVREDGTFVLSCALGEGALPGEYAVLVEWKQGAGKTKGRSPDLNAPDRLKKRYLNPKRPLLTAVVETKSNVLDAFELR